MMISAAARKQRKAQLIAEGDLLRMNISEERYAMDDRLNTQSFIRIALHRLVNAAYSIFGNALSRKAGRLSLSSLALSMLSFLARNRPRKPFLSISVMGIACGLIYYSLHKKQRKS